MKVLCVAEKPSIAKEVAQILSGGRLSRRPSPSKYNFNFDFQFDFPGHGRCDVTMTSVIGHIDVQDFPPAFGWGKCPPGRLFDAPMALDADPTKKAIHKNIAQEMRSAQVLFIWTDCDREGEAIGAEICRAAGVAIATASGGATGGNRGANGGALAAGSRGSPAVWRAKFSHLGRSHIVAAAQGPVPLDPLIIDAVTCRQEVDLKVGALFTRFLTDLFRGSKLIEDKEVVSYGTCQFPTLGFVVDRYRRVREFRPELYWTIDVAVEKQGTTTGFAWTKPRIFDRMYVYAVYSRCVEHAQATVATATRKPTSNMRPLPLTTVSLQRDCAAFFKLSAKASLAAAEKLYQAGLVLYPRTETDQFPPMDWAQMLAPYRAHAALGPYVQALLPEPPRLGSHNDKSHPPIHPIKCVEFAAVADPTQRKVYEYIVRRFLACVSPDAQGFAATATLAWAGEKFTATGLQVTARNYLDVYPYRKWESTTPIIDVAAGETVPVKSSALKDGKTAPPSHMTEQELIGLMDANGIGTDATIAEHIDKIVGRQYISRQKKGGTTILVPTDLGMGLIEGFSAIRFDDNVSLLKPFLRRRLENLLVDIESGTASRDAAVQETLGLYRRAFVLAAERQRELVRAAAGRIEGPL